MAKRTGYPGSGDNELPIRKVITIRWNCAEDFHYPRLAANIAFISKARLLEAQPEDIALTGVQRSCPVDDPNVENR